MRDSIRARRRAGLTLPEILVVCALVGFVGTLLFQTFATLGGFYSQVSRESRQLGAANMVCDQVQNACYGLPRQAIILQNTSQGQLISIQPLQGLSASGQAFYSDERIVLENAPDGLYWWRIGNQERTLGCPLTQFPPQSQDVLLKRRVLDEGWDLNLSFTSGHFPLQISLQDPDATLTQRSLAGQM